MKYVGSIFVFLAALTTTFAADGERRQKAADIMQQIKPVLIGKLNGTLTADQISTIDTQYDTFTTTLASKGLSADLLVAADTFYDNYLAVVPQKLRAEIRELWQDFKFDLAGCFRPLSRRWRRAITFFLARERSARFRAAVNKAYLSYAVEGTGTQTEQALDEVSAASEGDQEVVQNVTALKSELKADDAQSSAG